MIAGAIYPAKGGLEKSVVRIANALTSINDFVVHIYLNKAQEIAPTAQSNINNLCSIQEFMLRPYESTRIPIEEKNRIGFLTIKNKIQEVVDNSPKDKHVIISFSITSRGYTCQLIADTLGIPHVASIRGSDFNRDIHNQLYTAAIDFVVGRANYIVTTNMQQQKLIATLFGAQEKTTTIYNAIDRDFIRENWQHRKRATITLVSDVGFSFKKASHVMLNSFSSLLENGYPIILHLLGEIDEQLCSHWKSKCDYYRNKYPDNFVFHDHVESEQLLQIMLDSDIYVTSTLDEGCSNARMQALSLGVPIVSTNTGEIKDFNGKWGVYHNIELCNAADPGAFTKALEKMLQRVQQNEVTPNLEYVNYIKATFTSQYETFEWERVIRNLF